MANRLKIYACSGIGEIGTENYTYWTDNIDVLDSTQAVNNMLSLIESCTTRLQYEDMSENERIKCLNSIDLYAICLNVASDYTGSAKTLASAGKVVGSFVAKGAFDFVSLDNEERDKHLDELFAEISEAIRLHSDDYTGNERFDDWWQKNVVELDKVGLDAQQQNILSQYLENAVAEAKEKGVSGWEDDPKIKDYLSNAGNYFLYLYFTEKELAKLPYVFTKKRTYQQQIYNYCKSIYVSVYGTEAAMQRVIEKGIYDQYKMSPRKLCAEIASGKKVEGVGVLTEAMASVIAAAIPAFVSIVTAIIAALFAYKAQVDKTKYQSINEAAVNANVPDGEDMKGIKYNNSSNSKLWLIGAAGLAALMLFGGSSEKD